MRVGNNKIGSKSCDPRCHSKGMKEDETRIDPEHISECHHGIGWAANRVRTERSRETEGEGERVITWHIVRATCGQRRHIA